MDFEAVFRLLIKDFKKYRVDVALIGGFALHAAGVKRSTEDIDFLAAGEDMSKVKNIMASYGYELLHTSPDASNFIGKLHDLGRVDFLHAHRKYAKAMLARAQEEEMLGGAVRLKVVGVEDLIGLKVQSSSNDPRRYLQDMADIESLLRMHYKKLDMALLREYFALFNRQEELEQLLTKVKNAE